MWLAALQLIAAENSDLFAKICQAAGLEPVEAAQLACTSEAGKEYALCYGKVLSPQEGNLAGEIKDFLMAESQKYATIVTNNTEVFLKAL